MIISEIASDMMILRLDEIREHFEDAIKFRIVILTNHQTTSRMKNTGFSIENILDKKTRIEVWDIEKIMSLDIGGTESAPVEIDFVELFGTGIEALQADVNPNVKSYLCVLPGEYLSRIYDIYGQRILQSNVRSFLNFTGGTNKGMRNTLLLEPEKFFHTTMVSLLLLLITRPKERVDSFLLLTYTTCK